MSSMNPMDSYRAPYGEAHRYGLKRWLIAFYWILVLALAAIACLPLFMKLDSANSPSLGMTVSFAVFGIIAIFFLFRVTSRYVELNSQSIVVGGLTGTRTMQLDTIRGRRIFRTRNGSYIVLESVNPGVSRLSIPTNFAFDEYWNNWLQTIPDLDELDRKVILDAITSDTTLGSTPEERLKKLASAKSVAIALSLLAGAVAATLWFGSHAFNLGLFGVLDSILVILPWVSVLLIARNPMLYNVVSAKRDPRATLMFVLLAAGIGLLASPFPNIHSVASETLLGYACIPGILLLIALYATIAKPRLPKLLIVVLLFVSLYGYGVVLQINTQLDTSSIRQYSPSVLNKTTSSGRSTTYYLDLNPWDQMTEDQRISVSSTLYHSVKIGDSVCVTAHDGTLHVGWYSVDSCNSSSGPR